MKTRYTAQFEVPYSTPASPEEISERLRDFFSSREMKDCEVSVGERQGNPYVRVRQTLGLDDRDVFADDLSIFESLIEYIIEALRGDPYDDDVPPLTPKHILWANFTIRTVG